MGKKNRKIWHGGKSGVGRTRDKSQLRMGRCIQRIRDRSSESQRTKILGNTKAPNAVMGERLRMCGKERAEN